MPSLRYIVNLNIRREAVSLNNHLIKLKEKYRLKLVDNKKNNVELINYLYDKFNLKKCTNGKKIESTKMNCLHAECNKNHIPLNEMNVLIYEILPDELSCKYYEKYKQNENVFQPIYIMMETKTGYFYCNDNLLFTNLIIYRGINQYDIDHNTGDLSLYLRFIDELEMPSEN